MDFVPPESMNQGVRGNSVSAGIRTARARQNVTLRARHLRTRLRGRAGRFREAVGEARG
ncbi:hypothetical protein AKJ09_00266 [Labilithrix luteola]|uniref:Uncharacterized protein n=1 Tax=Labilithrix luteola TaxID=1391654 RepID=A0A0K1PJA6_9BACT|nr:hypothetical protein AKJ09_00266 [Labilithrix luteola]